jgi:hypothetical protein
MRSGVGSEADRRVRRLAGIALASFLLLGGCASDFAIEDAVPHPAADGTYGGPRDTGQFPNLNIRRKAATSQLTDAQVAANKKQLDAAKASANAHPSSTAGMNADTATMRQAGKQQSDEVLKDIEGQ